MPNPTAGPATPATTAGTSPAKGAPNRRPTPPRRLAAEPEPLTALDLANRMQDIGMHWWALIDGLFEQTHTEKAKAQPVPQWALDWLKDQGRHHATHEDMVNQGEALRDMLRLQDGQPAKYVYEVWGDRYTRLSLRHDSIGDAMPELEKFKASGNWPKAAIVRLHRHNGPRASDPALLDTLVGKVRLMGRTIGLTNDAEDGMLEFQDETGRSVTLRPSQFEGHPVLSRLSAEDLASVDNWVKYLAQARSERATTKGTP